jgi:hypothetical protein
LFDTPGSSVFPVAWVQGTGGFLFGLFVHRRRQIEHVWPALYVGLRVGERTQSGSRIVERSGN